MLEVIESRRDVMRRASAAGWLPNGDGFVDNEQADRLVAAQRHAAESQLAAVRDPLDRGDVAPDEELIVEGSPGQMVVRIASDEGCDGIVVATHGRTGFSRLFLGSVAEYVLRHAACPVILVPAPERLKDLAPRASAPSASDCTAA